jgi:hypothetical protein
MAGKAFSIELSVKQQALLQRRLDSNRYENLLEMFDDALRLMNTHDAAISEWLREEMEASLAEQLPPSPMEMICAAKVGKRAA